MSSGSNATRKSTVASTLFKATSRFQHQGVNDGQKAPRAVKRQKHSDPERELSAESNNCPDSLDEEKESTRDGTGRLTSRERSKKRFVGVRQRPSGRWVAEIKDTTQKIRLWLGTFDSAEDGARAYDEAAWLLRGANTRTNFVPAVTCDGTVLASKAARLIRLRQSAAASKSCEEGAHFSNIAEQTDPNLKVQGCGGDGVSSSHQREDIQQSIILDHLPSAVVDSRVTSPKVSSSPSVSTSKTGRMNGHRQDVPAEKLKREVAVSATTHVQDTADAGVKLKVGSFRNPNFSPLKLESQHSISSEHLSSFVGDSFVPSPQDSSSLTLPTSKAARLNYSRPNEVDPAQGDGAAHFATISVDRTVDVIDDQISSTLKLESDRSILSENFSAFTLDNFVTSPFIPYCVTSESRQSFPAEHFSAFVVDGLAPNHHQDMAPQYHLSCTTNRDHVSLYASDKEASYEDFGSLGVGRENHETIHRESSFTSSGQEINSGESLSYDENECGTDSKCDEIQLSTFYTEGVGSKCPVMYRTELDRSESRTFIRREREYPDLVAGLSWPPDFCFMDETNTDTGLFGVDLTCEQSGVYTSSFDFSAELGIDKDSCTSVLAEHLPDNSELLHRTQYEQTISAPQNFQECVLLTEPTELDYCLSSQFLPGPPLSLQEPYGLSSSSSMLWRDASSSVWDGWDGQSSGSTESTGANSLATDGGECSSPDQALWSSMDLAPLCMVAY